VNDCCILIYGLPPAYGRYLIPPPPAEIALINNPSITLTQRRIFFPAHSSLDTTEVEFSEYVEVKEEELSKERRRSGRWVYYKTWEMEGDDRKGKAVDVIMTHGMIFSLFS
jgi:acylglycerol lipase